MTTKHDFKIFVSAKEKELTDERLVVMEVINELGFLPVSSENRPASDIPMSFQNEEEVLECDVYIGIFYKEYSQPSINEFSIARPPEIPVLVFEKKIEYDDDKLREHELEEFLNKIKNPKSGVVVKRFDDIIKLREEVRYALIALLVRRFKEFKQLSVKSQKSDIIKQEVDNAITSRQTDRLITKIEKIEELTQKYGLVIAEDLRRASIIEYEIPKMYSRDGSNEVYARIKGTANNAFLDLLVIDPDNNQYWNPDPLSYDSALDKGTAKIKDEDYSSRWIFYIPSNARTGKYKALVLLYEDLLEPTKIRQAIAYAEQEFEVL